MIANVPRIRDTEAMLALLADLGVTVEWIEDNTVSLQADGIEDTDVDPDLAERIRASFLVAGPAAGALRLGVDAAARRRRDRPPAARPAPRRLPRARRARRARPPHQALRAQRRPALDRLLHGRAVRDGHGERAHGRGADARLERHPQRRLRAPRAGPRAHAQQDGRRDRGHRLERHVRPRHGRARRLRARGLARPHRDRLLHGARGRDGRRAADPRLRARGHADDLPRLRAARAAVDLGRLGHPRARAARSSSSRATPATTSPRSRTARGRPSRPTSPRSRWRSRPSPRARS